MRPNSTKRRRRVFGTIKQRPPRRTFYVLFSWGGRRYERVGGPTKAVARERLAETEVLLKRGIAVEVVLAEVYGDAHGSRLTFRDAVPLYLEYAATRKRPSTLKGDRSRLEMMMRTPWAGEFLTGLRSETLTRWATARTAAPFGGAPQEPGNEPGQVYVSTGRRARTRATSGATVNRDLNLGSALFRWARRMGHVTENPFREVERFSEKGRERTIHLTAVEARALVDGAPPFLRPVLVLALSTGMRKGSLLALRWRSVSIEGKALHVEAETEKAGRGLTIPLTAWPLGALRALRDARKVPAVDGSDAVLVCQGGAPLTEKVLRLGFTRAVRECEAIPTDKRGRVTFHTLRHTAATIMYEAGVPLSVIARILGHSTLSVTLRYAHFTDDLARDAVERLGDALWGDGEKSRDGANAEARPDAAHLPSTEGDRVGDTKPRLRVLPS